jgi:hypothetical protein
MAHSRSCSSTLPGNLSLSYGAAEPVLKTRRPDARVFAGGEALIV